MLTGIARFLSLILLLILTAPTFAETPGLSPATPIANINLQPAKDQHIHFTNLSVGLSAGFCDGNILSAGQISTYASLKNKCCLLKSRNLSSATVDLPSDQNQSETLMTHSIYKDDPRKTAGDTSLLLKLRALNGKSYELTCTDKGQPIPVTDTAIESAMGANVSLTKYYFPPPTGVPVEVSSTSALKSEIAPPFVGDEWEREEERKLMWYVKVADEPNFSTTKMTSAFEIFRNKNQTIKSLLHNYELVEGKSDPFCETNLAGARASYLFQLGIGPSVDNSGRYVLYLRTYPNSQGPVLTNYGFNDYDSEVFAVDYLSVLTDTRNNVVFANLAGSPNYLRSNRVRKYSYSSKNREAERLLLAQFESGKTQEHLSNDGHGYGQEQTSITTSSSLGSTSEPFKIEVSWTGNDFYAAPPFGRFSLLGYKFSFRPLMIFKNHHVVDPTTCTSVSIKDAGIDSQGKRHLVVIKTLANGVDCSPSDKHKITTNVRCEFRELPK